MLTDFESSKFKVHCSHSTVIHGIHMYTYKKYLRKQVAIFSYIYIYLCIH